MTDHPSCPCGSGQTYAACCQPLHTGSPAASPEALMCSRYTAFALELREYLLSSWHSSTRPSQLELTPTQWKRLEIFGSGEEGETGWVHFRATFLEQGQWSALEERSLFCREDGRWRYLKGTPEVLTLRPERNGSCPCGSGKKYKKCCLD